jgi:hypothetical protein
MNRARAREGFGSGTRQFAVRGGRVGAMSATATVRPRGQGPHGPCPAASRQPFSSYVPCARGLLLRHKLTVPDRTVEMIAKTIADSRKLESRAKPGLSPRARIKKALTHAAKLLEYTQRGTAEDQRLRRSISRRSSSLAQALSNLGVVVWLATATTPIDVVAVLERLKGGRPSKDELTRLIATLESVLPASGKPGRPREDTTHVLRGACIAWLRAGRADKCTWDVDSETVKGPLAAFARDLLNCCRLVPSDNAIYCALRYALRDCQGSLRRIR